jgi:hypothetical protein
MNSRTLLEALTGASNALANSNLVPILRHFYFSKDKVTAYNDVIGIEVPCVTGFVGAVPRTILGFLRSCNNNDEVSFTSTDKEVIVEAGGKQLKAPILEGSKRPIMLPKQGNAPPIHIGKQAIHALKICLLSVSSDSSRPEHLGITVIPGDDELQIFSTDSKTLTWVRSVPAKIEGKPSRVIPATPFCQQLIAFADTKTIDAIELGDDYAMAVAADGMTLFGKLVDSPQPLDFNDIVTKHVPKDYRTRTVPIPAGLKKVLDRAVVITSLDLAKARTRIVVKNGTATFSTKSDRGDETVDELPFKHDDVKLNVEAWRMRTVCDHFAFAKMLLKEDVAIFTSEKGQSVHVIATRE